MGKQEKAFLDGGNAHLLEEVTQCLRPVTQGSNVDTQVSISWCRSDRERMPLEGRDLGALQEHVHSALVLEVRGLREMKSQHISGIYGSLHYHKRNIPD